MPTSVLIGAGLCDSVGLIADGRFSGGTHGTVVGQVAAEDSTRGAITSIKGTDLIMIDANARLLQLNVADEELARCREVWQTTHSIETIGVSASLLVDTAAPIDISFAAKGLIVPAVYRVQVKKTGSIWRKRPKARAQIIRRVCKALEVEYGRPRLGNPTKPLDDLIFILISNRTSPQLAEQTYQRLRKKFPKWENILESPPSKLREVLKPAGLSRKKSHQIRSLLGKVRRDFGKCNLDVLARWQDEEIHEYLTALAGVSDKVAKCVMLYTLSSDVLPVDVHVYRVSKRLGWTARNRAAHAHEELEALISPSRRFAFHVDCIAHGRSVCRSKPDCYRCHIRKDCEYFKTAR